MTAQETPHTPDVAVEPGRPGRPAETPAGPETGHAAVVNDEGQYALWPLWRELPAGWYDTGVHGTREHCLNHIEQVWTDLRPRSIRDAVDAPHR